MSSVILELSQAEAQVVNVNGDYNISLPQNSDLLIEDGDSIQLKNVFIDTEQQSTQKIIIKQQIDARLDFLKYYIYSRIDNTATYNGSSTPTPRPVPIDAEPYILCRDISGPDLEAVSQLNVANFSDEGIFINFNYEIQYIDSRGKSIVFNSTQQSIVPFSDKVIDQAFVYDTNSPLILKITHAWRQDPFNSKKNGPALKPNQYPIITIKTETPVSQTSPHFEPVYFSRQPRIEKGNYTSTLLSKEINRQLQKAGTSGGQDKYLLENEFLGEYGTGYFLIRQDGNDIITITNPLVLGASQVDLEFEPDTNQFSWNYIHMPYFSIPSATAPAQPVVGYIQGSGSPAVDYHTVNKNSGIAFTSLYSIYTDGTQAGLWDTILGFDISNSDILVAWNAKTLTNYNNVATLQSVEINPRLQDGINTTGGFIALSSQVNRTTTDWWKPAITLGPLAGTPFLSTATDTFNILGSQDTISNTQFSFGYFLVEIQGNFRSGYYSNQKSPNIMAIVSRYYELNSFTSGSSDDSLIYTHKGDPITLSNFGVRIMTPQKVVADNLGTNTTVFLEIVKGQPQ